MRQHILCNTMLAALVAVFVPLSWSADPLPSAQGTLWPGESTTFEGVKITWEISEATRKNPTPEHTLSFAAGKTVLRDVEIARSRLWNENSLQASRQNYYTMAYIDGVYFRGDGHIRVPGTGTSGIVYDKNQDVVKYAGGTLLGMATDYAPFRIDFTAEKYPTEYDLTALPTKLDVFVSHVCPLRLNEWKFAISSDEMKLPDGSQYMELTAENTTTGEKSHMPVTFGSKRKFGRYTFDVSAYFPSSRTARFAVEADVDRQMRGRDAYVGGFEIGRTVQPFGETLTKLADDYGFNIEWVESPKGSTESVEYLKKYEISNWSYGRGTVGGLLAYMLSDRSSYRGLFDFEWADPTHLRVWAPNYERQMKNAEKQKEIVAKNRQVQDEFNRDYQSIIKVYPVERLTPATAKTLLEPEMQTYYLYSDPNRGDLTVQVKSATSAPSLNGAYIKRKVEESIVADEKANALVISAIPATHARIAGLLKQMEGMFEQRESAGELKRYRLSVALLEGVPAVAASSQSGRAAPRAVAPQGANYPAASMADMRLVGASQARDVSSVPASTTAVVRNPAGLDERLPSFVANHDDIHAIVQFLVQETGLNLALSPKVIGTVTVNLKGASVRQILDVILPPLGATYRESGGMVQILANQELLLAPPPPSPEESAALMKRYGLSSEELSTFSLAGVRELGTGIIDLVAEPGRTGRARLALTDAYQAEVQFIDVREPYLIVRGLLTEAAGGKVLVENALYLQKGKPSTLGLTNLRQALILVVTLESDL